MRNANPIIIFSILIGVGIWCALEGVPEILILIAAYIVSLLLLVGIGWLWEKKRKKKSN